MDLQGETLIEGQLRTRQAEVAEFFQALAPARVVIEVGTHSAWVWEVIAEYGHEVLVANPRLMDGSKRRKRKSDRIDADKLARLGGVDPKSLYPLRHRSTEVRQDLVMLRAREALVATRTDARWCLEGKHYVFSGNEPGKGVRFFLEDISASQPRAFSPEGVDALNFAVSPDGLYVLGVGPDQKGYLYPVSGGDPKVVAGMEPGDLPVQLQQRRPLGLPLPHRRHSGEGI